MLNFNCFGGRLLRWIFCSSMASFGLVLKADQPIMNMMPRWDGGYGVQFLLEDIHRSDLKLGDAVVGDGFTEDIQLFHFQGVYTWDRSIRLTFKLPYILDARREVLDLSGGKQVQHDSGVGDLTLALPLKKYFNLDGRSGSWTLAPQLRVPLGGRESNVYSVADRVWGTGLSLGYETETRHVFFSAGLTGWVFERVEPAELRASVDLGWNCRDNMQLLWETDVLLDEASQLLVSAGPAYYVRLMDEVHMRFEWKHDFKSRVSRTTADHGNGDRLSVGIGFVF